MKAKIKDRLRQALDIMDMKQADLVEKTGIDKGQLSSWLSGKYNPRQANISLLADTLCVNEAWLMGYDVPMFNETSKKTSEPLKIIDFYNMLNDIGKSEATKRVEELTLIDKYKINKKSETIKTPIAAYGGNGVEIHEANKVSDEEIAEAIKNVDFKLHDRLHKKH